MFWFFIWPHIKAFFAEFSLLFLAAGFLVGGVFLLTYQIPLLSRVQRVLAAVMFGIAIGLGCYVGGYHARGVFDGVEDLQRRLAAQKLLKEIDEANLADMRQKIDELTEKNRANAALANSLRERISSAPADAKVLDAPAHPTVLQAVRGGAK